MFYWSYASIPYDYYRKAAANSFIRVLHASPGAPGVDVYANETRIIENLKFSEFTKYLPVPPGNYNIKIYPAGKKDVPVIDTNLSVLPESMVTAAAIGSLPDVRLFPVMDSLGQQATSSASVRFVHLSPNDPSVDIALPDGTKVFSDVQYKGVSDYTTVRPGTYTLRVSPAGTNTIALSVPNVQLKSGICYTVYTVGLVGANPPLKALLSADGLMRWRDGGDEYQEPIYEDGELDEDVEYFIEDESRSIQDVNRVVEAFGSRFSSIYSELQGAGMDLRLIRFLVRTTVSYIDRYYSRYKGTTEQKTNAAVRDLRVANPWIFNIMRTFGMAPARILNVIRTIVSFAFDNLRIKPSPRPREEESI